ncbi:MFS general substrate transporter [Aureobasidium pullulans]|uniref:MFS general substrate transporter n=1 Tax=Aureobasidium pullulans TaxID=5580 RepID=A0A4S9TZ97_AURPU|nr:MFS general substrate transporter [Aureobasidium pullulans]THZ30106.1 MFS general substrate transporter [Aureobasidium pullulans]
MPPTNSVHSLKEIDAEKHEMVPIEVARGQNEHISAVDADFLAGFTNEQRRRVSRKVDWRLVPMLLILYLISFIDRANIGNAKIEGLLPSLNMSGTQYNIALAIFFVPYTLAEIPSNMILDKFNRPSVFMGTIVFVWGVIVMCTGFVTGFAGLCVTRVFLGLFEAGFFPGAILIISKWYLPHESQTRIAIFFTASALAGAFSGLLAYGIVRMDGVAGYEGWRWIFILEGLASAIAGLACFWLLIDTPARSTSWLSADEIRYLELRQVAIGRFKPAGHKEKHFDMRVFLTVLKDWKIYLLIIAFWSNVTPNYGLKFTMPQIMKNMGYSSANAQLLTIPAYTVGAISAYSFSVLSDRLKWRMPTIVVPQMAVVIAYAILFAKAADIKNNIGACYFAVCLACFGLYPIGPGVQAWNMNNLAGPSKRAMGIGFMTGVGNMGGITGSFIFIEKEAPKYPSGFGSSLAFAAAGIVACFTLEFLLWKINGKNAKLSEEEVRDKYSDEELDRMGDKSPLFRYTL